MQPSEGLLEKIRWRVRRATCGGFEIVRGLQDLSVILLNFSVHALVSRKGLVILISLHYEH